jgi:hypothetical protein
MLLKDISSWFGSASTYWYSEIEVKITDPEAQSIAKSSFDTKLNKLINAYNLYKSNTSEDELLSRLKVMVSYILLTTGTSTVPECPPVLNPGIPADPDLRLLYNMWVYTTAPENSLGLFEIELPDIVNTTAEYDSLKILLEESNVIDTERVMFLVNNMPAAIFDKLTYLQTHKPNITTLTTGETIENQIKTGTHLNEINEFFGWTIDHII